MKYFALCLWLVGTTSAYAQRYGCTDLLATNYDTSATHNDGSCLYPATTIAPTVSVVLDSHARETSGLTAWAGWLWTHNDDTDTHLYALDTTHAQAVQTLALPNVRNRDWEDITQDSTYLYVGDFGNNANGNRTDLHILRILKSSILAGAPLVDTIYFSYANQTNLAATGANNTNFDCEAFIAVGDSLYLFAKQWLDNKTTVYTLPKTAGTHLAQPRDSFDVQGLITGATYYPDKGITVLCGYASGLAGFVYVLYDYAGADFFGGNKRRLDISLSFHQIEAVATFDGLRYYISNEQISSFGIAQKLHTFDLSPYLGYYLYGILPTSTQQPAAKPSFVVFPNPTTDRLTIRHSSQSQKLLVTDLQGRVIWHTTTQGDTTTLDVQAWATGIYIVQMGAHRQRVEIYR